MVIIYYKSLTGLGQWGCARYEDVTHAQKHYLHACVASLTGTPPSRACATKQLKARLVKKATVYAMNEMLHLYMGSNFKK